MTLNRFVSISEENFTRGTEFVPERWEPLPENNPENKDRTDHRFLIYDLCAFETVRKCRGRSSARQYAGRK